MNINSFSNPNYEDNNTFECSLFCDIFVVCVLSITLSLFIRVYVSSYLGLKRKRLLLSIRSLGHEQWLLVYFSFQFQSSSIRSKKNLKNQLFFE